MIAMNFFRPLQTISNNGTSWKADILDFGTKFCMLFHYHMYINFDLLCFSHVLRQFSYRCQWLQPQTGYKGTTSWEQWLTCKVDVFLPGILASLEETETVHSQYPWDTYLCIQSQSPLTLSAVDERKTR